MTVRMGLAFALLASSVVAFAIPAHAQSAPLQAEAARDWFAMKDRMIKIADAMPADKFAFKATPAERSYAEQIMHVVIVDNQILRLLRPSAPVPTTNPNAASKAE